jgi:tetraacyldisaccharide 4'-kinase
MTLAERLLDVWYGKAPAPIGLRALIPLYRLLRALDRAPYTLGWRKPQRLPVPVIVVGNITVGGTGKTPLVIALVEALRERGWRPGVVSRGYGRNSDAPALIDDVVDAQKYGDEPQLIRLATSVPVAVGRDRAASGKLLLANHDCNVLIADDGLQHFPLLRNVEICVIDGERRFGNELLLPAGPLREPLSRLQSCTFRVCNAGIAQADEVSMALVGEAAVALVDATRQQPLSQFTGQCVHGVAGIGNPQRFFVKLQGAGIDVIPHAFPDHHAYRRADLDFGDALPVLMTSKDAVKCLAFARSNHWQVPVRAQLPTEFFDAVVARLV